MNTAMYSYFMSALYTIPALLVYAGGLIAALIFWSRMPRASLLTAIGTGLLIFIALLQPAVQQWIIRSAGSNLSSVAQTLQGINIILTLFRAVGMGLIVYAVFVDRPRLAEPAGFDPLPPPLPPTH
jgi:hypothetical protein